MWKKSLIAAAVYPETVVGWGDVVASPGASSSSGAPCSNYDSGCSPATAGGDSDDLDPAGGSLTSTGEECFGDEKLRGKMAAEDLGEAEEDDDDGTGDGVWTADIEQSFLEAMAIYPPCGRRKIILAEEGKMYGRNELIARYIKLRTGKTRTRKQVSSHIQVLGRRQSKFFMAAAASLKNPAPMNQLLSGLWQMQTPQKPAHSGPVFDMPPSPLLTPRKAHIGNFYGTPYARPLDHYTNSPAGIQPTRTGHDDNYGNSPAVRQTPCHGESLPLRQTPRHDQFDMPSMATPLRGGTSDNVAAVGSHSAATPSSRRCLGLAAAANHSPYGIIPTPQKGTPMGVGDFQVASLARRVDGCFSDLPGSPAAASVYGRTGASTPSSVRFMYGDVSSTGNGISSFRQQQQQQQPTTPYSDYQHQDASHMWNNAASLASDTQFSAAMNAMTPCNQAMDQLSLQQITNCPADLSLPPAWHGRSVAGPKLRLVQMSAFVELVDPQLQGCRHTFVNIDGDIGYDDPLLESIDIRQFYDKFPSSKGGLRDLYERGPQAAFFLVKFWADMNVDLPAVGDLFYATSTEFESSVNMSIHCSTTVCSFGRQVVEKLEKENAVSEDNKCYSYRMLRSPMCEYLKSFINKLHQLPQTNMMDSVLENFTILQVVTDSTTQETLLCVAFVFQVSSRERSGAGYHVYRLIDGS